MYALGKGVDKAWTSDNTVERRGTVGVSGRRR